MEERVISVQTKAAARTITPARFPAVLAGAVAVATPRPSPPRRFCRPEAGVSAPSRWAASDSFAATACGNTVSAVGF